MSLSTFKKLLSAFLLITVFLLLIALINSNIEIFRHTSFLSAKIAKKLGGNTKGVSRRNNAKVGKCRDVLSMTRGNWKTRPLSKKENKDIIAFITNAQARFRFPSNYERTDRLCGNVTHTGSKKASWFRALCDPRGPTPCCYHNKCTMKTVEECVCKDCYDMRNMKHAEYSSWIPSYSECPYKEHTPKEACDILSGANFTFVGDSLVRHVYTAMILIVTGNMKYGALQQDVSEDERKSCEGMYMFTEKLCRLLLDKTFWACDGSVYLNLLYYHHAGFGSQLKDAVLPMKEKSLVYIGIGSHNAFREARVQNDFLFPTLTYMKSENKTWPKFVWAASHAPGMLKSPIVLSQTYDGVKKFNAKMEPFLKSWNIPVFDTFNLTDGMMSFDGEHYGMGVNIVKANILLSYIREMRTKQKW